MAELAVFEWLGDKERTGVQRAQASCTVQPLLKSRWMDKANTAWARVNAGNSSMREPSVTRRL